jgi:carboxylesterase
VLLLHGFGDTPQSVQSLAEGLAEDGWIVTAPLLPGHGGSIEEFAAVGADEWIGAARQHWAVVRAAHPTAVLAGQSMGGALAVILAAEVPPAALMLAAPYLSMPWRGRIVALTSPVWGRLWPALVTADDASIQDAEERKHSRALGVVTPKTIRGLGRIVAEGRRALSRVTVPTIVVQSREDNRIRAAAAAGAFARLAARDKSLVWRTHTGHVVLADRGRDGVVALLREWLRNRLGTSPQG